MACECGAVFGRAVVPKVVALAMEALERRQQP